MAVRGNEQASLPAAVRNSPNGPRRDRLGVVPQTPSWVRMLLHPSERETRAGPENRAAGVVLPPLRAVECLSLVARPRPGPRLAAVHRRAGRGRYCPLVCAEGRLAPDGSLQPLRAGVEQMSLRLEVPVVPVYLHALLDVTSLHDS